MTSFLAGAARVFPLTQHDGPRLQQLLEEAADYCVLVLGRPPGPAEADSVIQAGPEDGIDPRNKMLFGISAAAGDDLIGVLDAFRDYPEPAAWYIGLLLLSPRARGTGLGRDITEAFAEMARRQGARELQLNVVEQNEAGHRFWIARGFTEVRRWRQVLGERESTFIRMRRSLRAV